MTAADVWNPPDLDGRVACVTGASYGVGRAVAEVLGECGATVYVTARSTQGHATKDPNWTVEHTADLVDQRGGRGIPLAVDFTSEKDVAGLFETVKREQRHLHLVVDNVWQWGPVESYWAPTWEQPTSRWDAMIHVGVRSFFHTVRAALPLMMESGGLIVTTQERPGDAEHFADNIVVDAAVAAQTRMVQYLGHELSSTHVSAILVYLGWVRTVNRGMGFDLEAHGISPAEFESMSQSPYLTGRAIAALAADPNTDQRSGAAVYAGDLALQYGFTDIDGRVPSYDCRRNLLSDDPG